MKHTEMMALSNRGGTRTAVERASAWLLSHLEAGSCLDAAGWVRARDIEVARSKTGVSRAALNRARRWLQKTGHIEKCRRGYQGPWMYRRVASTSRHCPLCGAVNGVPAPVEPVPTSEPPSLRWRSATLAGGPGTPMDCMGPASCGTAPVTSSRSRMPTRHGAWPGITRMPMSSSRSSPTDRVQAPEPRQTNGAQDLFQLPTAETQRVTKTVTNSVAPAVRLPRWAHPQRKTRAILLSMKKRPSKPVDTLAAANLLRHR